MAQEVSGSVKRFGPRYGRNSRFKLAKIEALTKKKYKCPYCNYEKVRRKSNGIWECEKCEAVFTGKAYTLPKKKSAIVVEKTEVKEIEEIENSEVEETGEKAEKYKEKAEEPKDDQMYQPEA